MRDAAKPCMFDAAMRRGAFRLASVSWLLGLSACGPGGAAETQPEQAAQLTSALGTAVSGSACDSATAGGGWVNTFMPQSDGTFSVELNNFVSAPGTPPQLDAVIGLSNGPAGAFTDMGPIVKFSPEGSIFARNGDHYEGGFPYTTGVGPFAFRLDVNLATHRYDFWVKHNDSPGKTFELLGSNFAFRTEQSGVTRLDNIGRFVDSAQGNIETCEFRYTSPAACRSSQADSWLSQAFPAQTGVLRLEFDATASDGSLDAVIGASNGEPSAFSALGPIVRFNPSGNFDARNGGVYAADSALPYAPGVAYHIALDIDRARAIYSVSVSSAGQTPVVLAHDYAFRTEQAQVPSLDHLAQFVDGTPGTLSVCALTVEY
jgi:hypothetical protein